MRTTILAAAAIALALTATGCGTGSGPGTGAGDATTPPLGDLADRSFTTTAAAAQQPPLVPGTSITLAFTADGVSADAGCNRMAGDAAYRDGTLVLTDGSLSMTEMGCAAPLMRQDRRIAAFLSARPAVSLDGDQLTLTSGDNVIQLRDSASVPDQPLVGTLWVLDSLGESGPDGTVSSVPSGVESTLRFEDGGVAVRPGCNTGHGKADISDDTIDFGPIALTRMYCEGPRGEVEDAVVAVLTGPVGYAIAGDQLTLTADSHTLTYRVADTANPAD